MPEFAYIARDLSGRKVTGRLSANNQSEALAALDQKALFPLQVLAQRERASRRGKKIKAQLIATTYGQLADLLRSGVPLLRSIEVLQKQAKNPTLQYVLGELHSQVQEGHTLPEAMARHPKAFSEMAVSMVRAGSEGGFLEEALERVAEFTEQQEDLKGRTIGALVYPCVLAVVGFVVVSVLLIFFVPMFETIFSRMREKGSLPVLTDWLLTFSGVLQRWWYLLFGGMIFVGVFFYMRMQTEEGRIWRDRTKLRLPMAGGIFRSFAVARFCRVLGTLLRNGVPILKSLDISSDATGNRILTKAIQEASENISAGESLAAPLAACGQFPPAVVEMIAVAEEANTLDTVLVQTADGLERRTWRQLDLMVRLLEPLLLAMVALVVLFLAIALLVPVIKMSTAI